MSQLIVDAILLGIGLSLLMGPIFFLIIEASLTKGFKAAILTDLGILMCDLGWLLIIYFGVSGYVVELFKNEYMGLIGGAIFSAFGIAYLLKKNHEVSSANTSNAVQGTFLKGFILTLFNPGVFVFWLTAVPIAYTKYESDKFSILAFFIIMLITIFCIDLVKIFFASKLKKLITPKVMKIISIITGIVFLFFGISLVGKFLFSDFSDSFF